MRRRHRHSVHRPVGWWWWRRCACGWTWPCPDRYERSSDTYGLRAAPPEVGARPSWDGPTRAVPVGEPAAVADPPFMTPGMLWRGHGGRWRP